MKNFRNLLIEKFQKYHRPFRIYPPEGPKHRKLGKVKGLINKQFPGNVLPYRSLRFRANFRPRSKRADE